MNLFTEIERVTKEIYKWQDAKSFVVWVGGCEEHSHLTYQQALALRDEYLEDGYDDVYIDRHEEASHEKV